MNDALDVIEVVTAGTESAGDGPAGDGVNRSEVAIAVQAVRDLAAAGVAGIAVITPFRAQADALEASLVETFPLADLERLALRVDTVHAFDCCAAARPGPPAMTRPPVTPSLPVTPAPPGPAPLHSPPPPTRPIGRNRSWAAHPGAVSGSRRAGGSFGHVSDGRRSRRHVAPTAASASCGDAPPITRSGHLVA